MQQDIQDTKCIYKTFKRSHMSIINWEFMSTLWQNLCIPGSITHSSSVQSQRTSTKMYNLPTQISFTTWPQKAHKWCAWRPKRSAVSTLWQVFFLFQHFVHSRQMCPFKNQVFFLPTMSKIFYFSWHTEKAYDLGTFQWKTIRLCSMPKSICHQEPIGQSHQSCPWKNEAFPMLQLSNEVWSKSHIGQTCGSHTWEAKTCLSTLQ